MEMKAKTSHQNHLTEGGKNNWESTNEYKNKVNEICRELSDKYSLILSTEKNWFKRLLLRIHFWREKTRKIDELSSWKNLHLEMRNEQ